MDASELACPAEALPQWWGCVGLFEWQPLLGSLILLLAAFITLRADDRREMRRRERKFAAVRALLPVTLAKITDYGFSALRWLESAVSGERFDWQAKRAAAPRLPEEILTLAAEFIEYADAHDTGLMQDVLSRMQLLNSRVEGLAIHDGHEPSAIRVDALALDAALISAGAARLFRFARRAEAEMPRQISWDDVKGALALAAIDEEDAPELYARIETRAARSADPFR